MRHTSQLFFISLQREISRRVRLFLALLVVWIFGRTLPAQRPIWLIGGSSGRAYTDNSAALHKYLVRAAPHLDVYWVMSKHSPDVDKAQAVGPVLYQENWRTYIYALRAQVHIISHGLHDVPGCASAQARAVKVRLGHGLTALKKTRGNALHPTAALNRIFDLVPVSSPFEQRIKREWGFDESKLVITGLARYDELLARARHSNPDPATILYMPTWRDWLSAENFADSTFFCQLRHFLSNPGLHALLDQHQTTLELYVHIGMWDRLDEFARASRWSNVRILPPHIELQEKIVASRLLITDYSSVCWDYLYLHKPVLFFQSDLDEYLARRGAYIDLRGELFGPRVGTAPQALAALEEVVASDFQCPDYADAMDAWRRTAFAYHDDGNCRRIVDEITRVIRRRQAAQTQACSVNERQARTTPS